MTALSKVDQIWQEVARTVVSSSDFIPASEMPLVATNDNVESLFEKHGTLFLERLQHQDKIEAIRKVCRDAAESLGSSDAAKDVAVALFGVGECGERSELASARMALAGVSHLVICCDNTPQAKACFEVPVFQTHQFILEAVAASKIRRLAKAHGLFSVLAACEEGIVIDPLFRFRCSAREILKQPAFVDYCKRYQITQIIWEEMVEVNAAPEMHGKAVMESARAVCELARDTLASNPHLLSFPGSRRDYLFKKKTELLYGLMQRHFPEVTWVPDADVRRVFADTDEKTKVKLKAEIEQNGLTCTLTRHPRNKKLHTLAAHCLSFAELYQQELRMTLGSLFTRVILDCMSDYISKQPQVVWV